jgi:uncharacterized PurR-regulated membrane protein YhhQ (DUF165 family)
MSLKTWVGSLFKDSNDINEKSVIGFAAFGVMTIFAVMDLVTGYFGKDLVVNEFIYNSFLIMTLGAFGIASVDKFINKKSMKSSQEEETPTEEYKPEEEL